MHFERFTLSGAGETVLVNLDNVSDIKHVASPYNGVYGTKIYLCSGKTLIVDEPFDAVASYIEQKQEERKKNKIYEE